MFVLNYCQSDWGRELVSQREKECRVKPSGAGRDVTICTWGYLPSSQKTLHAQVQQLSRARESASVKIADILGWLILAIWFGVRRKYRTFYFKSTLSRTAPTDITLCIWTLHFYPAPIWELVPNLVFLPTANVDIISISFLIPLH